MARNGSQTDAERMLAFVGFFSTDDGEGTSGAAMVTSERGYPLEFRVTTPVRPSAVQRALYGKSLEPYVITELIARRLIAELQRKPALVLTNRLGAIDAVSAHPMAFVARADSYIQTKQEGLHYRRVESPSEAESAIAIVASRDSVPDFEAFVTHIGLAFRYFDPVEAFERMKTALEVLAESDARYR